MGITDFSVTLLNKIIDQYHPKDVIELGSQQTYVAGERYGQYAHWYYLSKGITEYCCIDLNGENNALKFDLSTPCYRTDNNKVSTTPFDLVTNFGTAEHVGKDGTFSWEAIYQCFLNVHNFTKVGGIAIHENPLTGHWPGHGFQYFTEAFYNELAALTDYKILELGTTCAMGNCDTGMNVYCVLRKHSEKFPTLDQFKTLSLYHQ